MNTTTFSPPTTVYRGIYTSLYTRVPAEVVQHVEKAIWLKMTGQPGGARAIYSNELSAFQNEPVVVFEKADLELEYGRWGEAWRIYDSALRRLRDTGADLDLPEHRLMALTWTMLGVRHRGNVECVPAELERTKRWLQDVPVAEYTDIQASCIRRYVIAYLLLRLCSNYQNEALEFLPLDDENAEPTASRQPWNGLHLLRRSLVARKMFYEANGVFRPELNRTPLKDRDPILKEFVDAIAQIPVHNGRDLIEAQVRLQWAETHLQLHNAAGVFEELGKSESAFGRWCEEFGISNMATIPYYHALIALKMDLFGDHAVRIQIAEQLIDSTEPGQNSKLGACISLATDSAYALYESTGDEEYLAKFYTLHKRLEQFDEKESEDLCDLVVHRSGLITVTTRTLVDRQKSLEWIDGFFQRYPYFASPGDLQQLYDQRSLLLRGLRRLDEAKEAEEIAARLRDSGPVLGNWLHLSANKIMTSAGADLTPFDSEDEEDVYFYSMFPLKEDEDTGRLVVETLLDWLVEDVSSGLITLETYRTVLRISRSTFEASYGPEWKNKATEMKREGQVTLHLLLFPDDKHTGHVAEEQWDQLLLWLSKPPKGQRNKRLFCLLKLRNIRQFYFSEKRLWDLRIAELKDIIALEEKLPSQIRIVCRSIFRNAHAHLAETYMAKVGENLDLMDVNTYASLLEAEKSNNEAIKAVRNNQPDMLASQQRLGALICLTKIRRLQIQLKDQATDGRHTQHSDNVTDVSADPSADADTIKAELKEIRVTGLAKIQETEKIVNAAELDASWLDGLSGVHNRQLLSLFYMGSYTVGIAINLILNDADPPSAEAITECWNWVQKFKARSLTKTIGLRTAIPEGLKRQIMASEDARPLYEEMVSLRDKIETTEQSERFDLRKQLDLNRLRMMENPLLRRLIDLREGAPLDISDIEALEEGAGVTVVLVDWFYLPAYPDESKGSLLLFTARSNKTTTMDILTTSAQDIDTWQREYLSFSQLRFMEARQQFDAKLAGLVEPLRRRTAPDEFLVLCPSSTLHRLPLHALSINSLEGDSYEPLIHRNPIIYIHSHSLLRSCFSAAENARSSSTQLNPLFLAGIPRTDVVEGRYKAGRDSITSLAQRFGTDARIDETASKERFWSDATESSLLHVHTHCGFDFADPLAHHITFPMLADKPDQEDSNSVSAASADDKYKLTAKEVFGIRLLPGTHVNLIACSGGITDIKPGDEVMGLVPALLYSGASSTVSTLWNIRDTDGARFSQYFFESFVGQCEQRDEEVEDATTAPLGELEKVDGGRSTFVDVALAVQEAVMSMDEDLDEPLVSWAGFVLHGFWQFSVAGSVGVVDG